MTLDEHSEPATQGMLELEREQHCVLCVHYYIPESLCEIRKIGKKQVDWCEHFAWS